jgi:hypothetical protein
LNLQLFARLLAGEVKFVDRLVPWELFFIHSHFFKESDYYLFNTASLMDGNVEIVVMVDSGS